MREGRERRFSDGTLAPFVDNFLHDDRSVHNHRSADRGVDPFR
jgi:hypothetical protein